MTRLVSPAHPALAAERPQTIPLDDILLIAEEISVPVIDWPGNCHAIAAAFMRRFPVEGSRLTRGLWTGPIHRQSIFAGRTFTGHTWITLADNRVIDPTRFAFEMVAPYVYLGTPEHYDEAGLATQCNRPAPSPTNRNIVLTDAQAKILTVPGIFPLKNTISLPELGWIAMRPFFQRIDHKAIYQVIADLGHQGLIPVDAWHRFMAPEMISAKPGNRGWHQVPPAQVLSDAAALSLIVDEFLHPDSNGRVWKWAEGPDGPGLAEAMGPMDALQNLKDQPIEHLTVQDAQMLCMIGMEFLGAGNADRVEDFADAQGIGRTRISELLQKLGDHAGMTYCW